MFCFAYYVKSAQAPGTLVVKARTATPGGYPQRFAFDATASYTADKRIYADATTDATLVRSSGGIAGHGRVADPGRLDAHRPELREERRRAQPHRDRRADRHRHRDPRRR